MAENQAPISPAPPSDQLGYRPGSVEKKRAVLMYLLIGIISGLGKKEQSEYEQFHLKQAMGWWTVFVSFLIVSGVLLFIPLIKYIPLLVFLGMIIILAMCIKQASDGKFGIKKAGGLSIFAGIGEWILGIFDIKPSKE